LRDNLTPYDAAYVAVAELFDVVLLTADAKLARTPDIRCAVEVLPDRLPLRP
jgi:predicted nucleic acid-binding protein